MKPSTALLFKGVKVTLCACNSFIVQPRPAPVIMEIREYCVPGEQITPEQVRVQSRFQPCWVAALPIPAGFSKTGNSSLQVQIQSSILRFQAPPVICRTWQEPKQAQFLYIKLEATCGVLRTEEHLCFRSNINISVSHQGSWFLFFFLKSRVVLQLPGCHCHCHHCFILHAFFLSVFWFFSPKSCSCGFTLTQYSSCILNFMMQ